MINTTIGFAKCFSVEISKGIGIGVGFSGIFSTLTILALKYFKYNY